MDCLAFDLLTVVKNFGDIKKKNLFNDMNVRLCFPTVRQLVTAYKKPPAKEKA